MLNFKCKSHRGRSPGNKTDALCMVEIFNQIERVYAVVIQNKKAETIIPIICNSVAPNSTIVTDEAKCYLSLRTHNYVHKTVCHKYEFVAEDGTHTQNVESFNNCIKMEIKSRKGVKTDKRPLFLKEFCFLWNNKDDLFNAVFNIIKHS